MERVEEYLETILDIQKEGKVAKTKEIADRLNIKPSSVTEMLNKLSEMGYIEYQPYKGATLTKKGYIVAARIKRNYQIFTKFFKEFLEIEDEEKVHELSCTLEHIVDNEVIEKICILISGKCDVCESCDKEFITFDIAEDGKYKVVVAPHQFGKIGISPNREIKVREGKIIVESNVLEIDEKLKRFILLKPL